MALGPEFVTASAGGAAPGANNIHSAITSDAVLTANTDITVITANAGATGTWFVSAVCNWTCSNTTGTPEFWLTVNGVVVASWELGTSIANSVYEPPAVLTWIGSITSGQAIALHARMGTTAGTVKAQTSNPATNTATQLNAMQIA
jgi:hypothetical protein